MRINMQELPRTAMRDGVLVGDVYRANGGRGDAKFWLVVNTSSRMAHALGIDKDGNIVTSTSYGIHVFEQRELIGRCSEIETFQPNIEWIVP